MKELGAFAVLFLIFAAGDYVSYKTKAIVSMLFTGSILLLAGFWLKIIPQTLFQDSGLIPIAGTLTAMLIVHMGTMMSGREFLRQWKTVLVCIAALLGITIFVYFIGQFILGRQYAITAAPPVAGGLVAGLMMSEAAKAGNQPELAIYAVLLVVVQGFIGYPVASIALKKEARRLSEVYNKGQAGGAPAAKTAVEEKHLIPALPADLQTPNVLLAKLALAALLSVWLAQLTSNVVNKYIICLIVGVVFCELGLLESNILTKSNSFGIAMAGVIVAVFSSLASASPAVVLKLLWPMLGALILGVIGIAIGAIPAGKLLGLSPAMSVAVGSTALFGFPGTYILSQEVAKGMSGKDEKEKAFIMDQIFPKMLIAGFVTVTIGSVVLAGILVKYF